MSERTDTGIEQQSQQSQHGQRHLVFGDDGSAAADVVWLWITNHAWPGWRISVVTARPPSGPPAGSDRSTPHPWEPPAPRRLASPGDVTGVEHLVSDADPRLVLDSFDDADLVAIGPRGTGLLKHLHIGSTAEWLVSSHRPLAPVVVVRSARPTRHVLLCVDGSPHAGRATEAVAALPWLEDLRVTVLGVTDGDTEVERGVEAAARLLESRGVASAQRQVMTAVPGTVTFDVRSTILHVLAEEGPDLVAMGTRGLGGVRRLVLGSTASAVVHHAPCSVLVARAAEESRGR